MRLPNVLPGTSPAPTSADSLRPEKLGVVKRTELFTRAGPPLGLAPEAGGAP
jgi:hypothetical protein